MVKTTKIKHTPVNPRYPYLCLTLVGDDEHAYSILSRLQRVLRRGGVPKDEIDAVMAEATNSDYDHLLATVMSTVETD